jgi:large subunit ribosomal protein L6
MKQTITEEIIIPEGVSVTYTNGDLTVKAKNSVTRRIYRPEISVSVSGNKILLTAELATQREKRHIYTMRAHIRNMLVGAQEGHTYKLKICSGHFPMNVSVTKERLEVKNFLGEAVPRRLALKKEVTVSVDGDEIVVTSPYIELAGAQASDIEQLTRVTNRDRRIFQDGLFIIEKDGEKL